MALERKMKRSISFWVHCAEIPVALGIEDAVAVSSPAAFVCLARSWSSLRRGCLSLSFKGRFCSRSRAYFRPLAIGSRRTSGRKALWLSSCLGGCCSQKPFATGIPKLNTLFR